MHASIAVERPGWRQWLVRSRGIHVSVLSIVKLEIHAACRKMNGGKTRHIAARRGLGIQRRIIPRWSQHAIRNAKDRAWRKIVSLSKKQKKNSVCISFDGEERRTLWILLLVYRQKWKRRRKEGERRWWRDKFKWGKNEKRISTPFKRVKRANAMSNTPTKIHQGSIRG